MWLSPCRLSVPTPPPPPATCANSSSAAACNAPIARFAATHASASSCSPTKHDVVSPSGVVGHGASVAHSAPRTRRGAAEGRGMSRPTSAAWC